MLDWAIQAHGGGGVSDEFAARVLLCAARGRCGFADGPDEVHRNQIAKLELGRHAGPQPELMPRPPGHGA